MQFSSPSLVTEGVRITVQTLFLPEQSAAATSTYCFAYRIQIRNESEETVQLLRRHWVIFDGQGQRRVVIGDGVVGKQPVLEPGQEHAYVSGSVFATMVGKMEGHYTMRRLATGEEFRVAIPPFVLEVPFLAN